MKITTSYKVKIKHYNDIFRETVALYRAAVGFLAEVCLAEWDAISALNGSKARLTCVESLTHRTAGRPQVPYDFDQRFYKFPSYLRRSAINEAVGKVSSYKSNLVNWESSDPKARGRKPRLEGYGNTYPCMYRTDMYQETGDPYAVRIKAFIRNTWDWITLSLNKGDADYIARRCASRKKLAPTLLKRGKEWFLAFPFEERASLCDTPVTESTIAAVDLGLNNSTCVSVMRPDGTVLGRHFLKLPKEYDCLEHATGRIRKGQRHGAKKTPRLWAIAKGINDGVAVKTAQFIIETAVLYDCDVIVMEHLDVRGRKRGSKKQRLHLWKAMYVQDIVSIKAHRLGMRISRVNAWGTSRLAYDGSGYTERGHDAGLASYSLCRFKSGKVYNCDLNASYNIGARYYIREILAALPARDRLRTEAKVPRCCKRSTCTLSDLISLNAALAA